MKKQSQHILHDSFDVSVLSELNLSNSKDGTILIIHASVGSGHRSAAYALQEAFCELQKSGEIPSGITTEVLDCLDFGRWRIDGDKTASMFTGSTRPIYDYVWRYTLTGRLLWGGGTSWSRIFFPAFTELVRKKKPIAIIATHITAANIAVGSRMITKQDFPVVCVPTDYETEGWWPHSSCDMFCVATEYMAETLRPRKVENERIAITGLPTKPAFMKTHSKITTRDKYQLPQDKQVVLILAGAYLPTPYVHFRNALFKIMPDLNELENLHFVFVAGADKSYAQELQEACEEHHLHNVSVLGYVDEMAALMASSDLVVCKSGGLTVTECLCAKVPMLLLGKSYGQEKINIRMLTSMGAAFHTTTYRELFQKLQQFNSNPHIMDSLLINAAYIRKPEAALTIARLTLVLANRMVPRTSSCQKKRFAHFYWGEKPAHSR